MINDFTLVSKVVLFEDKQAFGTLVEKYQCRIRALFMKLTLGNKALSDDLAQDTFIRVYLNIASFKAVAQFSTWLYRVAYNVFLEHMRKQKIYVGIDEHPEFVTNSTSDMGMDLSNALSKLREEERICILLSYMDGFAHVDIAKITGMPIGTIKTHIARGKDKLKIFLQS